MKIKHEFLFGAEAGRPRTNKGNPRTKPQIGRTAAVGPVRAVHAVRAAFSAGNTAQGSHVQE